MYTQAAAKDGAKIQSLESIGLEIGAHVGENPGVEIVVVANSALYRIGSRRRRCAGRIVGRVYAVGVQAQVIVQGLAVGE